MNRTLVVGDIHGGLKALQQVLENASISKSDTIIFLGDYVDGWSESAQTIEFLIDFSQNHNCVFIKGNHDVWCEEWLRTNESNPKWLFHGGQATVDSYKDFSTTQKKRHLNFRSNEILLY